MPPTFSVTAFDGNAERVALTSARATQQAWFYAPVQQQAFDACAGTVALPCFAYDLDTQRGGAAGAQRSGAKSYVCTSYERLYARCQAQRPEERRWYEIMSDDYWCHGYLDLDLCQRTNAGVDGAALSELVKQHLYAFAAQAYPEVVRTPSDLSFVETTASDGDKFSRHLIVHVREAAFENFKHFGAFMRRFQLWLLEREGAPESNRFFVWRRDRKPLPVPERAELARRLREERSGLAADYVCFLDLSVYTSHRAFRFYGQHKFDASEADPQRRKLWLLNEVERRRSAPTWSEASAALPRDNFLDSMIQYFAQPPRHILSCTEPDGSEPRSTSDRWEHIFGRSAPTTTAPGAIRRSPSTPIVGALTAALESSLIEFFRRLYENVHIETPRYDRDSATLTVGVRSHRCALAERTHRSNHIYVVVYALHGSWRQKCFSCVDQATVPQALPQALATALYAFVRQDRMHVTIDLTAAFAWI